MYKYHTILINGHDFYKECRLIPTSKPVVNPPEVKTEYVDLPNEDGSLDYTDSLGYWVPDQSLVKFKDRQGSWEFLVNPDEIAWATMYEKLTQIVTGGKTTVILTDDFFHKWEGRVWINDIKTNEHDNRVTLNYILYPYKKVNSKFTRSIQQDWLWNELFDNTIFYGTFSVDSRYGKWRNLYNPTSEVIYPTIDVAYNPKTFKVWHKLDLYNGQFIDANTTVSFNQSGKPCDVYKSDAGSYHINNGSSKARITFSGYDKFAVSIRSYAESNYDYMIMGALDYKIPSNAAYNSTNIVTHTRGRSSASYWYTHTFSNLNGEEHFVEIKYRKNGSTNSYDDRGYFLIRKDLLVESQAKESELAKVTINELTYTLKDRNNTNVPLQPGNNIAYFSLPENASSIVSINYDLKGKWL